MLILLSQQSCLRNYEAGPAHAPLLTTTWCILLATEGYGDPVVIRSGTSPTVSYILSVCQLEVRIRGSEFDK